MIEVEGLHSSKGIAFIPSKGNPRKPRLRAKTYSTLRTSLKKAQFFPKSTFSISKTTRYPFNEKLGEKNGKSKIRYTSRLPS